MHTAEGVESVRRRRVVLRFVVHYLEMVLAMMVGMGLSAPLWMWLMPGVYERPGPHVLLMAVGMAVGMGVWMQVRGHDWQMITEMAAVMVAPFAVLLLPYQAGWLSAATLSPLGHTLMFLAMLVLMLARRDHYSRPQGWVLPWRTRDQRMAADSAPSVADGQEER